MYLEQSTNWRHFPDWNLEVLVFEERGKPENTEKNLSEQGREPIWSPLFAIIYLFVDFNFIRFYIFLYLFFNLMVFNEANSSYIITILVTFLCTPGYVV